MGCDPFAASEQKSTGVATSFTPTQEKWLNKALDIYGPKLGQGQPQYEGPRVANFSPQQEALTNVQGYQDAFNSNRAMPLFGETGTAIADAMSGKTGAQPLDINQANQVFQQTRANPSYEDFNRFLTPSIQESYAGPGFMGSAKGQAVTQAGTDLAKNLDVQRSSFLWDTENANREIANQNANRQLLAADKGMQYGQLPTQEAQARLTGQTGAFNLASAEQMQRQAVIDTEIQKFAEKYRITDPETLSAIMAFLGFTYSTSINKGSATGPGFGYAVGSSLAGGVGTGLGEAMGTKLFTGGGGGGGG